MDRLGTFRISDQQQCPLQLQFPDASLFCRVLSGVSAIAPLVLGEDAQQDPRGGYRGGCAQGTVLTFVGLPGLVPLPWWHRISIFAYSLPSCLVVNDAVNVAMIKWRVPTAVA